MPTVKPNYCPILPRIYPYVKMADGLVPLVRIASIFMTPIQIDWITIPYAIDYPSRRRK